MAGSPDFGTNPILLSPGVATAFLDLQEAEQAATSLGERVRQVVILLVPRRLAIAL